MSQAEILLPKKNKGRGIWGKVICCCDNKNINVKYNFQPLWLELLQVKCWNNFGHHTAEEMNIERYEDRFRGEKLRKSMYEGLSERKGESAPDALDRAPRKWETKKKVTQPLIKNLCDLPSGEKSHSVAKATWTNQAPTAQAALVGACINIY